MIAAGLEDEFWLAAVGLAVLPVVCIVDDCVGWELAVEEVDVNPSVSIAPVVVKLRKLEPKTPPYIAS